MARKRHRHRNPSRNQWIAIGVGSAAVLTTTTILVVRHRHRSAPGGGGGGLQGGSGPVGGIGHAQFNGELQWLCKQPASLSLSARETLINGVFVPTMNRELAKRPPQLDPNQVQAVEVAVAENIINQTCQPVTAATRAMALTLAHAAWLRTQGLSGQ